MEPLFHPHPGLLPPPSHRPPAVVTSTHLPLMDHHHHSAHPFASPYLLAAAQASTLPPNLTAALAANAAAAAADRHRLTSAFQAPLGTTSSSKLGQQLSPGQSKYSIASLTASSTDSLDSRHLMVSPEAAGSDKLGSDTGSNIDINDSSSGHGLALDDRDLENRPLISNRHFGEVSTGDKKKSMKKGRNTKLARLSINARERRRMHDLNDALDDLR